MKEWVAVHGEAARVQAQLDLRRRGVLSYEDEQRIYGERDFVTPTDSECLGVGVRLIAVHCD